MNWKEKIQAAWTNKGTIVEGFFNAFVSCSDEVKAEAMKRLEVCRSNECNLYNQKGENTENLKAVFPGKESCGGCGCDLYAKAHAMSAHCFLREIQIRNFKELISNGYIQTLQDGFIDKSFANILSAENIASLAADDSQLWILLQALKAKGVDVPVGPDPLWENIITDEQEIEINKIAYQKQFENRK